MKKPQPETSHVAPPPPVAIVDTMDGQVALLTLAIDIPVQNDRGLEELTKRFRLLKPASSHGEPVTSIVLDFFAGAFIGFKVTVGADQVKRVPMSNVTSFEMWKAPRA